MSLILSSIITNKYDKIYDGILIHTYVYELKFKVTRNVKHSLYSMNVIRSVITSPVGNKIKQTVISSQLNSIL